MDLSRLEVYNKSNLIVFDISVGDSPEQVAKFITDCKEAKESLYFIGDGAIEGKLQQVSWQIFLEGSPTRQQRVITRLRSRW